jgi:transcriptional regulator with XRE-family HTH domain
MGATEGKAAGMMVEQIDLRRLTPGRRITVLRTALGLRQHQAGGLLGVSQPWLSMAERGLVDPEQAARVERALGTLLRSRLDDHQAGGGDAAEHH